MIFLDYNICFYPRVCQLPFSHILHYENLTSEWPQFLRSIGKTQHAELPKENKGGENVLQGYFEDISEAEKSKLFQKFVHDFNMFGYTLQDEF